MCPRRGSPGKEGFQGCQIVGQRFVCAGRDAAFSKGMLKFEEVDASQFGGSDLANVAALIKCARQFKAKFGRR